jgi:hypothetical protein
LDAAKTSREIRDEVYMRRAVAYYKDMKDKGMIPPLSDVEI